MLLDGRLNRVAVPDHRSAGRRRAEQRPDDGPACGGAGQESKIPAHPASVDSIPSSANRRTVSMSTIIRRGAAEIARNAQAVIAIELLCALQALFCG